MASYARLKSVGASIEGGGILSNIDELRTSLQRYVMIRNQNIFASVREKMGNIAMKAAQFTTFSDKGKIRAEISNAPNKGSTGQGKPYVGQYKIINWERKLKGLKPLGNTNRPIIGHKFIKKTTKDLGMGSGAFKTTSYHTKPIFGTRKPEIRNGKKVEKHMDGKYKSFIQARIRGIKWLRIGWAIAAKKLGKPFGKGDFGDDTMARLDGRAYGGGSEIRKYSDTKYEFRIWNGVGIFDHRYRGKKATALPLRPDSDIKKARDIQETALKKAVTEEIKNMNKLILERLLKVWTGKNIKVQAI
ncbi:MAG: hypothetical protein EB127_04525 [Alphaproteobacteria bacterium]|nr:hypothetical protein [Alphaproteobacteria bacterium]